MGNKKILNAPLVKGDKVQLISMNDPNKVPPSMIGKVTFVHDVMGSKIYGVNWYSPSGQKVSSLSLIDDIDPETGKRIDNWFKIVEEGNEDLQEYYIVKKKSEILKESKYIPKTFVELSSKYNISEIYKYLENLRRSGLTNMFGATPYLYMGSERIEHLHKYDETYDDESEESYNYIIENADSIKNMLIRGAMKDLNDNSNIRKLESLVKKDAQNLLELFFKMKGGASFMK